MFKDFWRHFWQPTIQEFGECVKITEEYSKSSKMHKELKDMLLQSARLSMENEAITQFLRPSIPMEFRRIIMPGTIKFYYKRCGNASTVDPLQRYGMFSWKFQSISARQFPDNHSMLKEFARSYSEIRKSTLVSLFSSVRLGDQDA